MAKYYYNGVLLPSIPTDILVENPYVWIRKNTSSGNYDLCFAPQPWYINGDMYFPDISSVMSYRYTVPITTSGDATEWTYANSGTFSAYTLDSARTVMWSNHDIPNGSATSTTIYLYATDPVPENEAKPKELSYGVYTNFYPNGNGLYYNVNDLTINYVAPVKKYSTYTITMTEVGNRLRVCHSSVDPATIKADTSVTSITEPSSFQAGYVFTYFAQADGWLVIYVSNAGEYPEINIVTNGAGGDGTPLYDRKYLIRSGSTIYTINDGALTVLTETELSAALFRAYGVDDLPDGALLVDLIDPEVLYWHDSTDDPPVLAATVMGASPVPQVVVTDVQDMSDSSILGIESATVTASEDVLFAMSFDDGVTWKAYNGSQWLVVDTENSGMTAATFQNIGLDAWSEVVTSNAYRVRFVLMSTESYMTSVVINYLN